MEPCLSIRHFLAALSRFVLGKGERAKRGGPLSARLQA